MGARDRLRIFWRIILVKICIKTGKWLYFTKCKMLLSTIFTLVTNKESEKFPLLECLVLN